MRTLYRLCVLLFLGLQARAQAPIFTGSFKELFKGPDNARQREAWLNGLRAWRDKQRAELHYDNSFYSNPALKWVNRTFIYVQMMAHDRFFYDAVTRKYTVNRYLADLKKRYGGIDAVLIWPTYPNIGVDNRNQFDLTADMPGGQAAVKQMIKDFKANGVRVFFPIMIWDHGTRRQEMKMSEALVKEMKQLGADGMNGDTMFGVSEDFYQYAKSENYPLALQPELSLASLKMLEWNRLSWGYFWGYEQAPGVNVYKWMEPRHQVHITNRWAVDKTFDLQWAFFNGIGYNSWENVWAIWNQIPDRYAEAIRRISAVYHAYPDVWSSKDWEPYAPTLQDNVYATRFPSAGRIVYNLINRDSTEHTGAQISVPYHPGDTYYDLWNGHRLKPEIKSGTAILSFDIEGYGYGSVLIAQGPLRAAETAFVTRMATMSKRKLKSYTADWKPAQQQIVAIAKTKVAANAPEGMIKIPGTNSYTFESTGVMIEGNELPTAVGVQHSWESHPSRSQKHEMKVASFYMDKYPVTNRQYQKFMDATHYHPADDHNFLKDWVQGHYTTGTGDAPVTWVSLEDARAYAAWAGKRLPHEWEWQYAAQGNDGRKYPWGNENIQANYPPADTTRAMRKPTPVSAYPAGASAFGVADMVGNVWQWTDEYHDLHSRTAIVKGSSYYHAQTSGWYFPAALEVNKYGKYLLMAPSLDRAGTIGFRCVVDAE